MKNFSLILILTTVSILMSSFGYPNIENKLINTNSSSTENTFLFEKNYYKILSDSASVQKSPSTTSNLKPEPKKIIDTIESTSEDEKQNQYVLSKQFDKLKKMLKKYKAIEKNNQWKKIEIDSTAFTVLNPMDSGAVVKQIRERLFIVGDLNNDSKSEVYNTELMAGVLNYKKRYGLALNYQLTLQHINQMNEPISNRIETIKLNMERCLEMPEDIANATEYVFVNIPSYKLSYIKDGVNQFVSDVFVGTKWTKTEVFTSMIDRIVFSPYWNVPQSIVDNELKLKILADKNYLEKNNLEWNNGYLRQKPGPTNSLGLVKFLFPNEYDIYMHDTPSKSLFLLEKRAFSHGCINIKDAKGLAYSLLKNNADWPIEKIDVAMNGEKETPYQLENKIPVYMGYFTAWVSEDTGEINFFEDIYDKDINTEPLLNFNSLVMD